MMQPMDPKNPFAVAMPGPIDVPAVQMPTPKRGGMFGGKGAKIGKFLQDFLINYSASQGNPAAMSFLQQRQAQQEAQQRAQQEEQQYERKRSDGWQDWVQREQWKLANGGGDELGQMMRSAGIDPASEQGQALYRQYVQNKVNPFTQMRVQNPDGSETLQFMRPPQAPAAPVGRLTPIDDGGPTLAPSGGFPRPF